MFNIAVCTGNICRPPMAEALLQAGPAHAGRGELDIAGPWYGGAADFDLAWQQIQAATGPVVAAVRRKLVAS